MKYCTKCGNELFDEAIFCPKCGCLCTIQPQDQNPSVENMNYEGQFNAPVAEEKSNGFAIAGFVCSFFFPILGWVFGGIGLNNAKKNNGKGQGLALAAIIIASVNFVLSLILQQYSDISIF